jgi:hypothetical protein
VRPTRCAIRRVQPMSNGSTLSENFTGPPAGDTP